MSLLATRGLCARLTSTEISSPSSGWDLYDAVASGPHTGGLNAHPWRNRSDEGGDQVEEGVEEGAATRVAKGAHRRRKACLGESSPVGAYTLYTAADSAIRLELVVLGALVNGDGFGLQLDRPLQFAFRRIEARLHDSHHRAGDLLDTA